jgi:hypothetical protein
MLACQRLAVSCALLLTLFASMAPAEAPLAPAPRPLPDQAPAPELSPEDVARFQLAALSADAAVPERIAACYRFASPDNRDHTGPIDKFAKLFDLPSYRVMLSARRYLVGKAIRDKDEAYLLVTMVDDRGELAMFRFFLSKQNKAPYAGCWMTDSVIRLRTPEPEESRQREQTPAI